MGTSEVQKQAHSSPVPDAQSNESPCIREPELKRPETDLRDPV